MNLASLNSIACFKYCTWSCKFLHAPMWYFDAICWVSDSQTQENLNNLSKAVAMVLNILSSLEPFFASNHNHFYQTLHQYEPSSCVPFKWASYNFPSLKPSPHRVQWSLYWPVLTDKWYFRFISLEYDLIQYSHLCLLPSCPRICVAETFSISTQSTVIFESCCL